MSLRILFADDSVTAQNMGKKILTEAGYEVVAVSNGAAAVKKIAEQKPDIIILDVYMPGYSGLEVCEKVRSSIATIKTPVLLTVGKMEPYKPEEANRVRADGVIIKPFEASDLLAIVKKFEERIEQAPTAAEAEPDVVAQPVDEIVIQPVGKNHEPARPLGQPIVEVPDHMATSSAFSDLLGTDATGMEQFHVPPVAEAASSGHPEQGSTSAKPPDYDVSLAWRHQPEAHAAAAERPAAAPTAAAATPARPAQIPVYQEARPERYEVVPTAAGPIGDIEIAREPRLQESAEQTTRNTVADLREPDLVPTAHEAEAIEETETVEAVPRAVEVARAAVEEVPGMGKAVRQETWPVASEVKDPKAEAGTAPSPAEADFEARVAAAMAAYGQAAGTGEATAGASEAAAESIAEPVHEPAGRTEATAAETNPTKAPAGEIAARVEAELSGASHAVAQAATANEGEHENIAQAVHRVMERMKENLVEEIVRELKNKK